MANLSEVLYILLYYLIFLIFLVSALYEDEAGKYDWSIKSIGSLKFGFFDQVHHTSRRIIVASELNVLSSISSRTGELIWRQVFEEFRPIDALLHRDNILITISDNANIIRSWDSNLGLLDWETTTHSLTISRGDFISAFLNDRNNIMILTSYSLIFVSSAGIVLWEFNLDVNDGIVFMKVYSNKNNYVVIGHSKNESRIYWFILTSSQLSAKNYIYVPHSDTIINSCILIKMTNIICIDGLSNTILVSSLGGETNNHFSSLTLSGFDIDWNPISKIILYSTENLYKNTNLFYISQLSSRSIHLFEFFPDSVSTQLVYSFTTNNGIVLTTDSILEGELIIFSLYFYDRTLHVQCYDAYKRELSYSLELSVDIDKFHGYPLNIIPYLFSKKGQTLGYRLLISFQDSSISLVQHTGKVSWTREEALAEILTARLFHFPTLNKDMDYINMLVESVSTRNPINGFIYMIKSQLRLLQDTLISLQKAWEEYYTNSTSIHYDHNIIGFSTIAILIAKPGKIFCYDTKTGRLLWDLFEPNLESFSTSNYDELFVTKLLSEPGQSDQYSVLAIIGKSKSNTNCRGTLAILINPLNGFILGGYPQCLPYSTIQVVDIRSDSESNQMHIGLIDSEYKMHIFPSNSISAISRECEVFLFTANVQLGSLQGYTYHIENENNMNLIKTWNYYFDTDQEEIIFIAIKQSFERVYSTARILHDRTVLYKYLNPNIITVVSESRNEKSHFVHLYFFDSVAGILIYQTHHKNAKVTVRPVLSENWIVYHIINIKEKRHELITLEMYQANETPNNHSVSSFDFNSVKLLTSAYILPDNLYAMAVTHTLRGITPKHIILGFSDGTLLSLPKVSIEPSLPSEAYQTPPPQSTYLTSPMIPMFYLRAINYNLSLVRLREILVVPDIMESTCSLLSYGLDIFFATTSPSNTFDQLAVDFNYNMIMLVIVALVVATLVGAKISSYFRVKSMWR